MVHSFHIPVMGLSYTIDTPIKVAHYGINSVVSIIEDTLLEVVRKTYLEKEGKTFQAIPDHEEDSKAKRVTEYLNMMYDITSQKFQKFKENCTLAEAKKYIQLLSEDSYIKKGYENLSKLKSSDFDLISYVRKHAEIGAVDVNIMTKVDKVNYKNGEALPREFNDAHASLRGFAQSKLNSSVVLSAGLNPSLVSYMANFSDFFPNAEGQFKKKIILKVSDYRSALIQAKFLAKKGLWVTEFRIESGLNCGGHAFATDGLLMGPNLHEFYVNRESMYSELKTLYIDVLKDKGLETPKGELQLKISAQGGVGTALEHKFLLEYYKLDSVGWGSPFLLVPEVSALDSKTRDELSAASEKDLYLSHISPLGVPMNNMRTSSMGAKRLERIEMDKPGSPCVKKYLAFNTEFSDKPLCTASRKYQSKKIKELNSLDLLEEDYQEAYDQITEKECICTGLGTSFLIENNQSTKVVGEGVTLCPGPNMAYFSKQVSMQEMISHIYGRANVLTRQDRPHMFVKELMLNIDYLRNQIKDYRKKPDSKNLKRLNLFIDNLNQSITYYIELFSKYAQQLGDHAALSIQQFKSEKETISQLSKELNS
ncbi:MAG: hypothetical protein KDB74_06080 [Flavobacteriales bacterium]|nr:hypothetical protein [Flavobacteriales bacterium]